MSAVARFKTLIREYVDAHSLKDLSDRSGVAKSHISMILTGRRKRIELDTADRLLRGMGRTFADLDIPRDPDHESTSDFPS